MNSIKGNQSCCVPQCSSWARKDTERKSYHIFPQNDGSKVYLDTEDGRVLLPRRDAWIMRLRIGKPVSKHMRVCSLHFKEDDFFKHNKGGKKHSLKKIAVPSQNLPTGKILPKRRTYKYQLHCKSYLQSEDDIQAATRVMKLQQGSSFQEGRDHAEDYMNVGNSMKSNIEDSLGEHETNIKGDANCHIVNIRERIFLTKLSSRTNQSAQLGNKKLYSIII